MMVAAHSSDLAAAAAAGLRTAHVARSDEKGKGRGEAVPSVSVDISPRISGTWQKNWTRSSFANFLARATFPASTYPDCGAFHLRLEKPVGDLAEIVECRESGDH